MYAAAVALVEAAPGAAGLATAAASVLAAVERGCYTVEDCYQAVV